MGFLSGRVAFARYRVGGRSPRMFGPDHLERLTAHAIGRQRRATADGVEVGWTAGDDVLDTDFDLAKNVVDDTLHFALRVDSQKLPTDLLQAYTRVELRALAANNPSGLPSARQRREARDVARQRLEAEARDGRFLRRKTYPILWDTRSHEVLVGTTSANALERLHGLFQQTFGHGLEAVGAGRRAFLLAEARRQTRGVDDARPTPFVADTPSELAWLPDEDSRDFLGNEFLLWLWYTLDMDGDTSALADGSEVAVMMARSLVLECPRGQTGRESIRSEGPTRLPEAHRAVQAGKLPRQAGLTLARHGHQFELTLHAESLAVTGAKLPVPEAEGERAEREERIARLRDLLETLDLLYDAFGRRRFGANWAKELPAIQKWLQRDPRGRFAATG
jgi:hypothetical protein